MKIMTVEECLARLQADMDAREGGNEALSMTSDVEDIICVMEHLENLRDLRNAMGAILQ